MNNVVEYGTEIELKYGQLQNTLDWCKKNCANSWDIAICREAGSDPGLYKFIFTDQRDYVTFMIWRA